MYKYNSDTPKLDFSVEPLSADCLAEMEKHTRYVTGDEQNHYNKISLNYEDTLKTLGYPDPDEIAQMCKKYCMSRKWSRSDVEIADFGCGTGFVAEALIQCGFKKIHGIDCSEGMLEIADEKDIYQNLVQHQLGGKDYLEKFPGALKNKFDFVVAGGLIEVLNYDANIFQQMLFAVKNGGYIIFSAQYSYVGNFEYHETINNLQKERRVQYVDDKLFTRFGNLNQIIGKYSKMPAKIYVFKKTEGDSMIRSYLLKRSSTNVISEKSD